jgi:carbon storage regulator
LNEAVVIGDGIEIVVLRNGRDGVRLGIKAPSHVPVHRREIYDTIKAANASAAARSVQSEGLVERLRQRIEQW